MTLENGGDHAWYLADVAKANPPTRLGGLIQILGLQDGETIMEPSDREGLNPFLIPLAQREKDQSLLCYIRWPTQKEDMDLQLVRTTSTGVMLESMSTDQYMHRLVAEADYYSHEHAQDLLCIMLESSNADGKRPSYSAGDSLEFLKSSKITANSDADRRVVLDK